MIDKLNITIENKITKKIKYYLWLNNGWWSKSEYDSRGNLIYYESSSGHWSKKEYGSKGNQIYSENSNVIIKDDRKTKHTNKE